MPEGTTLEEYTVACAQAWKAGQTQRKNGMILFVFPESRKVRLEVGYGLEGAMPDALARRVLDEQVLPRFRTGDYDGGIAAGRRGRDRRDEGRVQGLRDARRASEAEAAESVPFPLVLLLLFLLLLRRSSRPCAAAGAAGTGT